MINISFAFFAFFCFASAIKASSSLPLSSSYYNTTGIKDLTRQKRAKDNISTLKSVSSPRDPSGSILPTKQPAPAFTFAVWDDTGMICILAKFEATFSINYATANGIQQLTSRIPIDATSKGRCDYLLDDKPVLDVQWIGGFTFRIIFEKVDENNWGVNSMDLLYNTADSLFRGSVKGGKSVAKTREKRLGMFTTAMGKSYLCPSAPVINMYEPKTNQEVVLRMANIQMQAYQLQKAKFSPISRCGQVGFGSGVPAPLYISLEQDDSVQIIVGSITLMVSCLTIVGYAGYRSWVVRRVDYDTMI